MAELKVRGCSFRHLFRHRAQGIWEGVFDELVVVTIDTRLSKNHRGWLSSYKETLKRRFQQEEIYITIHQIEVI